VNEMMNKIKANYKQYCKDKRVIEEAPLSYLNWLELEVQAWMEQDEERRKYNTTVGD